ncbi:MAG: hypothetical protein QOH04_1010 [Sphingomonadales bacterium]|jgi:hypothetical protein|nr:hypothetical protein [Sphingomonadales bacterium]
MGDEFDGAVAHSYPYRFVTAQSSNVERLRRLRQSLESREDWVACESSFFAHWEVSLSRHGEDDLGWLLSSDCLDSIREKVSSWFDQPFSPRIDVLAHKMERGHYSELHNDSPRLGRETHRLNVYLNEAWRPAFRGELRIAGSQTADEDARLIHPVLGSVMAFEASSDSFHGVRPVAGGTRYSVIFYLWHVANTPEVGAAVLEANDGAIRAFEPWLASRYSALLALLEASGAADIEHGSSNLLKHVVQTACLLASWGLPEHVCVSALLDAMDDQMIANHASYLTAEEIEPQIAAAAAELVLALAAPRRSPGDRVEPYLLALRFANVVAALPHVAFGHDKWVLRREDFAPVSSDLPAPARQLARVLFDHPVDARAAR